VPQVLCPVLVGRDEETRALLTALAAAEAGHGGTVFLAGEPGIGKSRLVREAVRAAGERGLIVLAAAGPLGHHPGHHGGVLRLRAGPGLLANMAISCRFRRAGPG
jgi:AAA ATPase domain